MKKNDLHHQVANELGIVSGMVQLALRKLEPSVEDSAKSVRHCLERADAAVNRLKSLMEELRRQDSPDSQS
jgi:two-component sensor histidine kinase